jgi:hypothetical protein
MKSKLVVALLIILLGLPLLNAFDCSTIANREYCEEIENSEATEEEKEYLLANGSDEEVEQMADWLMYLATTEHQDEQANLRYILTHPMNDEQLARWCDFQGSTYEMYDREAGTGLVKRSEDGRTIVVPEDKMFASPENAKRALEELRKSLR